MYSAIQVLANLRFYSRYLSETEIRDIYWNEERAEFQPTIPRPVIAAGPGGFNPGWAIGSRQQVTGH